MQRRSDLAAGLSLAGVVERSHRTERPDHRRVLSDITRLVEGAT